MLALKKALETIGLSPNETAVLLVLLESGHMFVAAIARAAKLNRTTTYGVLKLLGDKGLVSSVKKEGAVRYQSIAPGQLPAYIERRRETLAETKQQIAELIPQLKLLRAKGGTLPKVQFFEGVEGVKQAYEDTLENNIGKILLDLTGTDSVIRKMGQEWVDYYLAKRTRLGIKCLCLAPDTEWSHIIKDLDEKQLRTTKFIPTEFAFNSEVNTYDNKVGIFSFSLENPVAVIIEDENIAHTVRQFFNFMALHAH